MTSERFNQLLNGPLSHPLPMMAITRLALALKIVLDAGGPEAEKALEEHCRERTRRDAPDPEADQTDW